MPQDPASALSILDYGVIIGYLIFTLAIGVYFGKRIKTGSEFFLAGRSLPWWAIGMSLVATDIGGTDIIGVGGASYKHGIAVANFEWIGCVPAMILGALYVVPFLYRTGVYTVPEYLERRYNVGVRTVLASCWLIFMACNLGIMLLASAKMMHSLMGWDEWFSILTMAILVGAYTSVGGLAAVVYTDVLQCIILILGCLLLVFFGLYEVGGINNLQQKVLEQAASPTSHHLELILPVDTPSPFPWPGILIGLAMIMSPAYWIGNQAIIQRSLGANSVFAAKASYVWGALLKNIIPVIIAIPGLIALVLFPGLEDGDQAIPKLVTTILPSGFRGVFFAAFLAAMMSSVDSYLNSAATLVSYDFLKRFSKNAISEERLLTVGRITTILCVVWAVAFAFVLMQLEGSGIYAIFQTLMAFFQGPALAILLTGMMWRRATGRAAFVALLVGIATAVALYTLNHRVVAEALNLRPLFQIQEPFLYFSIWSFLVTLLLVIVLSFLTKPEPTTKSNLVIWEKPTSDSKRSLQGEYEGAEGR